LRFFFKINGVIIWSMFGQGVCILLKHILEVFALGIISCGHGSTSNEGIV
jgi:hypothetical protein